VNVETAIALTALGFSALVAVFGGLGYVLPRPDSATRFMWRYLMWGALYATTTCYLVLAFRRDDWLLVGVNVFILFSIQIRVTHWWKTAEQWRNLERIDPPRWVGNP